jgi:uncharacterized protein (TIGR00730 family)
MIDTILSKDSESTENPNENSDRKINRIAFLGGASIEPDDQHFKSAFETAKLLAENGYEIMNGGGPGIMRASTLGAHGAGGSVTAVTYHPSVKHKNFEGVDPENKFDQEIVTNDYFDRTKVMLQNADVHIVFKGATGTISEFGMSWASSRIHEGHHKPIVLFGDFWEHFIEEFQTHMELRAGEVELLKVCETPGEVLEYIKSLG